MDKPHKKLIAWQKAMDVVETIYEITRTLPREEIYGLTSQLRRAAVSVPSNIAEGAGRSTTQFRNYLSVAIGSLNELATQLEILWRIGYLDRKAVERVEVFVDECLALLTDSARVSTKLD